MNRPSRTRDPRRLAVHPDWRRDRRDTPWLAYDATVSTQLRLKAQIVVHFHTEKGDLVSASLHIGYQTGRYPNRVSGHRPETWQTVRADMRTMTRILAGPARALLTDRFLRDWLTLLVPRDVELAWWRRLSR